MWYLNITEWWIGNDRKQNDSALIWDTVFYLEWHRKSLKKHLSPMTVSRNRNLQNTDHHNWWSFIFYVFKRQHWFLQCRCQYDSMVLATEEWIVWMFHRRSGTDSAKLKYWEKNLFTCQFVHHKFYTEGPGIEPGSFSVTGRRLTHLTYCIMENIVLIMGLI
jgi:hypothetical protein